MLKIDTIKGVNVYTYEGILDRQNCAIFFKEIKLNLSPNKKIVLDLSSLSYVDSHFIGKLFEILDYILKKSCSIIVVIKQDNVKDTLTTVGITKIVDIVDTTKKALDLI